MSKRKALDKKLAQMETKKGERVLYSKSSTPQPFRPFCARRRERKTYAKEEEQDELYRLRSA